MLSTPPCLLKRNTQPSLPLLPRDSIFYIATFVECVRFVNELISKHGLVNSTSVCPPAPLANHCSPSLTTTRHWPTSLRHTPEEGVMLPAEVLSRCLCHCCQHKTLMIYNTRVCSLEMLCSLVCWCFEGLCGGCQSFQGVCMFLVWFLVLVDQVLEVIWRFLSFFYEFDNVFSKFWV